VGRDLFSGSSGWWVVVEWICHRFFFGIWSGVFLCSAFGHGGGGCLGGRDWFDGRVAG